jgi:hypothetical protein
VSIVITKGPSLIPLTVAGNDQELILVGEVVLLDIGVSGDNLVLGRQLGTLLELKVTNGAREGKVSIHSAKIDKATGSCDSVLLV